MLSLPRRKPKYQTNIEQLSANQQLKYAGILLLVLSAIKLQENGRVDRIAGELLADVEMEGAA